MKRVLTLLAPVSLFITERIWQNLRSKGIAEGESVHLTSWPEVDEKKIDTNLEFGFNIALEIIEKGLAERDNAKVGLRWPLPSVTATISNKLFGNEYFREELKEIISRQLNLKEVVVKKKDNSTTTAVLDTKITPELEAEGFARELARRIQSERKKLGMKKEDVIELKVWSEKKYMVIFTPYLDFLKERTNSKKIIFSDEKPENDSLSFTIKEKHFSIKIS